MKFKVEYPLKHPNAVIVHVNQSLTDKSCEVFKIGSITPDKESPTPAPVIEILAIPGVTVVQLFRYRLSVEKGDVFEWEDLFPQVLAIIKSYYSPGGEFVETKPPYQSYTEGGSFKERPLPSSKQKS